MIKFKQAFKLHSNQFFFLLNSVKIFTLSSFFFILLIPHIFAEEENSWSRWQEESKIEVSIIGSSIIDLDSNNRLIRAYVDIINYDPSNGQFMMTIVQSATEKILSEKEILIREKSNGEAGADIAYMINDDEIIINGTKILGDYSIEIYSENGNATASTLFSIIHPSETGIISTSEISDLEEITEDIEDLNETENIDEQIEELSEIENIQKIPDWVKNIFILYAEGSITENELISALSFLIDEGIILVN